MFAKILETEATVSWQLTDVGDEIIDLSHRLAKGQNVCMPRPNVSVNEKTTLELLQYLDERGWHLQAWLGDGKPPPVDVIQKRPPQLWCNPGVVTVSKTYLLCV